MIDSTKTIELLIPQFGSVKKVLAADKKELEKLVRGKNYSAF